MLKEQLKTTFINDKEAAINQWVQKSIAGLFCGFVLFYFVIHCIDLYQLCYLRDYSQMQITEAEIIDVEATNGYRASYRFQTIEDSLNPSGKWFSSRSEYTTGQFPRMDYITITEEEYEVFLANPKSSLCVRYVKNNPRINKPCSRTTPEHYQFIVTIAASCVVIIITCISYIVKHFPILPAVREFFSLFFRLFFR